LTVFRGNSYAAWGLGLVPQNQDANVAPVPGVGQPQVLTGTDVNPLEADGVFNSLLRLDQALASFDLVKIERAAAKLDDNFIDLTFVKAELGSKANSLQTLKNRIEREDIEIRATLSTEIDTDIVKAVSELTARQANMQATLQLIGRSLQLSVFDYL
jgi:flagellin-like hook-associated protein FlgL